MTGCLLDYHYLKENYKLIAIDLSKQYALDADQKAIQHTNFTGNLDRLESGWMIFILEKVKETIFHKELYEYCKSVQ